MVDITHWALLAPFVFLSGLQEICMDHYQLQMFMGTLMEWPRQHISW